MEKKQQERIFLVLSFIALATLTACRFQSEHSDFRTNYFRIIQIKSVDWKQLLVFNEELLHPIFRKIIITLFGDPQAYFFVTGFFIVGVMLHANRQYSPDLYMGVLLYYCIGGYFSANNITRQYIAISITILAWKYILDQKLWKYLLMILLAMGFHTSAIIAIPLYFLASQRFNKNVLSVYILFGAIIAIFNRPIVRVMQIFVYSDYGSGYGTESSNPLRLVWAVITIACAWLFNRRSFEQIELQTGNGIVYGDRLRNLICNGAVIYCIFSVFSALNMLLFSRVAAFFSLCSILTIQYSLESLSLRSNKHLMKIALFSLATIWFIVMNINGKLIPTPYTPFWEIVGRAR